MRTVLILSFAFVAFMVPISYAVVDDALSAPQREAKRALMQALKQPERFALEGTGWITMSGSDGKSMTARIKVGPWSRDRRPFEILSLERDGKKVPVPHRFYPPMPGRWVSQLARDHELLEQNYRILSEGSDTVASRPCLKVRIVSRYPDRPSHLVWVDREKPVILRREFIGTKRRMEAGFEEVSIRERQRQPRESKDRGGKRWQHEVGGPLSGFTVETTEDRSELGFHPIERETLPHGFQRKRFRTMHLTLQWPVPRTMSASVAMYSDGMEGLVVMQIKTSDLKALEEITKAHKDPQIWQAMSQSGFPKELIRRGSSARVEIGETTLVAAGSIHQNEIKLLVAQFLTD
jgi:hypothetical protein